MSRKSNPPIQSLLCSLQPHLHHLINRRMEYNEPLTSGPELCPLRQQVADEVGRKSGTLGVVTVQNLTRDSESRPAVNSLEFSHFSGSVCLHTFFKIGFVFLLNTRHWGSSKLLDNLIVQSCSSGIGDEC